MVILALYVSKITVGSSSVHARTASVHNQLSLAHDLLRVTFSVPLIKFHIV
jgi:hypothetical protein